MSDSFDVVLKLILDEAATARIKSGVSTVAAEFKKVEGAEKLVTSEAKKQEQVIITAMKKEASAINKLASLRSKELKELKERASWIERGSKPLLAVGLAGLAATALISKKYMDSVKEAEQKRLGVLEETADKSKALEAERVDVIRSNAEKIKGIEEDIADKRVSLADTVRQAEEKISDVRKSLRDTLKGIANSREDEERSYKRQLEDISLIGVELSDEQRKQMELSRAKEDHALKMKDFAEQEKDAKKKAAQEVLKIEKETQREQQKIAIEVQKLEEQKRANRDMEKIALAKIAKDEAAVQAERDIANAKNSKTIIGILSSSKKWEESQMRIGKVATEVIIPYLEKAADIAEKVSKYAEANPGMVEAGLKGLAGVTALGGLGMLVSKGITLYADIKMIAVGDMQLLAAKMMSDAATKQLAAVGGGSGVAKGLGIGGGAATAAGGTGTAVAGGAAGVSVGTIAAMAVGIIAMNVAYAKGADLLKQKFNEMTNASAASSTAFSITTDSILAVMTAGIYPLGQAILGWIEGTNQLTESSNRAKNEVQGQANANAQVAGTANGASRGLDGFANSIVGFMSSLFSGGAKAPKHDYTGYAYSRTYAMAQDGKRQFVMSGDMTRQAERMLGGQLNQQMVMSAMGSNSSRSVTFNGRFSGEYSKGMKREIENNVLGRMTEALKPK